MIFIQSWLYDASVWPKCTSFDSLAATKSGILSETRVSANRASFGVSSDKLGRNNDMKAIRFIFSVALLVCYAGSRSGYAQDSAFTYQGRLSGDASAADARYEMTFTLYDAATNGNVVGSQTVAPVAVTNGLFTATVDFGSSTFDGGARWLEISLTVFGSDMV